MLALMFLLMQQETCPWLNAATARGFLGLPAGSPVAVQVARESCRFTGGAGSELRIVVQTIDPPKSAYTARAAACGESPEPLRAVGNEAVVCTTDEPARATKVVGRVRDQIFSVVITTPDRKRARAVAEQVAGILF